MSPQDDDRIEAFFNEWAPRIEAESQPNSLVGLTEDEIRQLAEDQHVKSLPVAYLKFLRLMGRSAGLLLRGTDAFYPSIIGLKDDAKNLMEAEGFGGLLPRDAFVFAMHQGYQVYWFQSTEGENPTVYLFQEGDGGVSREWPTFTD